MPSILATWMFLGGVAAGGAQETHDPAPAPPPLEEFRALAEELRAGENQYYGLAPLRALRERVQGELTPEERFASCAQLAVLEAQQGFVPEALERIDEALAIVEPRAAEAAPGSPAREALLSAHLTRALICMRLAENRNCLAHHNPESCLFPIQGGGVHREAGPAREALRSLQAYLALEPENLGARWLLNLVAMSLGDPEVVPEEWRLDLSGAAPSPVHFVDVAPSLGVNTVDLAGGVIVDDLDGDGRLDILTSTSDPSRSLTFHRNRGDGGFEDCTAGSGLDQQLGGLNLVAGDADNDGDVDVLVLRGAWQGEDGRMRKSLLRNDGKGRFEDVTRVAGLAEPRPTQAAVWGDFDNDGDLDLYVVNESSERRNLPFPSQMFLNQGDGTFVDVAAAAGVTNDRFAKGVTAGDHDEDGDLDLYVSNLGPNRLYQNRGDGTFEDVAEDLGVTQPEGRSFAPWFFDFDQDGDLDLFVGAYDAQVEHVARDYFGLPHGTPPPALYQNQGDGTFRDVAREAGLDHAWMPMGANFGDVDGDGWFDLYLGTGNPRFETLVPNVLLRNVGGTHFEDITIAAGVGHLQKGHGVAFADLDGDGDQDLYHQLGGFYPVDRFANALFRNSGTGAHFLKVQLRGTQSNRLGVGARVTVVLDTPGGPRELHFAAGSVSSFGGSPVGQLEMGLGDAHGIEELRVWWPTSGIRSVYRGVPMDCTVRVVEGAEGVEVVGEE